MGMISEACDVAILGSGFAGSLTALILQRIGLRPVLIDKAAHPRFAIGESSTPAANIVLRDLAIRYDLPRLLPLVKFGPWQRTYPHLGCGLKRGFSYFQHVPGRAFEPQDDHANELLVTASAGDDQSDTHWFRADVDQFLVNEARDAGTTVWERTAVEELIPTGDTWNIRARSEQGELRIGAKFLIDATGEAGLLPRTLAIPRDDGRLHTHSRTIFAHFHGVRDWRSLLEAAGGRVGDHPFSCDHAAQHHVLDGAWVWVLRFTNGLTSVGLVLDERRFPLNPAQSPEDEWSQWLARYPSLAELLRDVRIADPPGRLIRTGRLQRCWRQAAGNSWALLPHTAGFIDPLNSTGIAHSLCGIERLTNCLQQNWQTDRLPQELCQYERTVLNEIAHIDRLVDGCFMSFGQFPLLVSYSMLFFAAATTYERQRLQNPGFNGAFFGADQAHFTAIVAQAHDELRQLTKRTATPTECRDFQDRLLHALVPYNHVGLGDRSVHNMYRYTAPSEL